MEPLAHLIQVYLEIGQKRTFASAIAWPGWCRSERTEDAALQALLNSAPRYARVLQASQLPFQPPTDVVGFAVVERCVGTTTTDFGAPDRPAVSDTTPIDDAELHRLQTLLRAYWHAFDGIVQDATGKTFRTGPRGGGRDVHGIVQHVLGAEHSYLTTLGWKNVRGAASHAWQDRHHLRQTVLEALAAAAHGELPTHGPRGGARWSPRYFVRRAGWHVLDHAWEMEDRMH